MANSKNYKTCLLATLKYGRLGHPPADSHHTAVHLVQEPFSAPVFPVHGRSSPLDFPCDELKEQSFLAF